nr:hypothetical protein [Tanacetum cinerariifolium]
MIFDGMLRNLDNVSGKIFMYPRFIQTFLDKQVDGLPTHKEKYDVSFHTKKVFTNMKRVGKGYSRKETSLFPTMVGPNQVQMGKGRGNSLVRATTIASSLEAEQDSGNIDKTQTKTTTNEPSSQGTSSGDGPRRQDTMEDTSAYTRNSLKRLYKVGLTVKVISSSDDEALDKEDTSKQGRIYEIDADEDIALVSKHDDVSTQDNIVQYEGIDDVGKEEVVEVVTTANMLIDTVVDVAQVTTAIADIPVSVAKTIVTTALIITAESTKTNIEETTTTKTASSQQPQVQDKGKGKAKLIKEPGMPKKRKHQIRADKELAEKLQAKTQAEIDEEDRLARESSKGTKSK